MQYHTDKANHGHARVAWDAAREPEHHQSQYELLYHGNTQPHGWVPLSLHRAQKAACGGVRAVLGPKPNSTYAVIK